MFSMATAMLARGKLMDSTSKKIAILAESAKYDVSCSSSGSRRNNPKKLLGSTVNSGVCHSFTEDGRCVSLLKILYTNYCIFDCAYCINRRSNDIPRASFAPHELAKLTMEYYRRNYIEGLFLSSGVIKNADYTMEQMLAAVRELRNIHGFNGYIHMKTIPGASRELVQEAGFYADRLSVNIEIPSERNLVRLAPEKNHSSVYLPMHYIHQGLLENAENRKKFHSAPNFAPAGQSTQMIVGASNECDADILRLSSALYKGPQLRRVYYSAFIPVNGYDARLPALPGAPLVRENRLYQADWLMRFYQFKADEIANVQYPDLDLEIDPKTAWALRYPEFFPVNLKTAEYADILRVPGIGVLSAKRIIASRRFGALTVEHLKKFGVVLKRARYFITCSGQQAPLVNEIGSAKVRQIILGKQKDLAKRYQLSLFNFTGQIPLSN